MSVPVSAASPRDQGLLWEDFQSSFQVWKTWADSGLRLLRNYCVPFSLPLSAPRILITPLSTGHKKISWLSTGRRVQTPELSNRQKEFCQPWLSPKILRFLKSSFIWMCAVAGEQRPVLMVDVKTFLKYKYRQGRETSE